MDLCRAAAREFLGTPEADNGFILPELEDGLPDINLQDLWAEVNSVNFTRLEKGCESLLIAAIFLRNWKPKAVDGSNLEAARSLLFWAAKVTLPGEEFAGFWEQFQLADGTERRSIRSKLKVPRLKSTAGISVLRRINDILPIHKVEDAVSILSTLAAFTSKDDPWATQNALEDASSIFEGYESAVRSKNGASLAPLLGDILKETVKPLFSKTKTPAITAAGRKNVHPVPAPRFDPTLFDPETKPWKSKDVYAVTVLSWIIENYRPTDQSTLEAHFPLLVPPLLSLIDDETLAYKARGCQLLESLLRPLEVSKSDILQRTNLDSVFQDAVSPCLLSIPTITPESDSIHLLRSAYPALLSVIRTRFQTKGPQPPPISPNEEDKRIASLTRLLRHSLISSYNHISNPRPAEDTSISSFPHPALSTLLLEQLAPVLSALGSHSTKHLQEVIPILTPTLTNPFGTAYLQLLSAATEALRTLLLNAWPRVWRWRGHILAGLCGCWLHICDDERDIRANEALPADTVLVLEALKSALKECAVVLMVILVDSVDEEGRKIDVSAEFGELVAGDERLRSLLIENEHVKAAR